MAFLNIPVRDYGQENSSASLPVADAIGDPALTDLFNAIDGVIIGNIGQATLNIHTNKDAGPGGAATDKWAQRRLKYLCRYHDAVTLEPLRLEIPCPDMTLLAGNVDFVDLAAGAGLAFKTNFDLFAKARKTGNAVVLDSVELVGRKTKK